MLAFLGGRVIASLLAAGALAGFLLYAKNHLENTGYERAHREMLEQAARKSEEGRRLFHAPVDAGERERLLLPRDTPDN